MFRPTASWPVLKLRAELLRRTRAFFEERGFLEVETPLLSADVVVDRHIEPFAVEMDERPTARHAHRANEPADAPRGARRMWLQTSPEFGMKRLLAAGATAIYQITRAFRREEQGPLHNAEFTIVEWYRAGDDLAAGMTLLSQLAEALLDRGAAEHLSYAEAFERYAGVDPHRAAASELAAAAERAGITPPASYAAADRDAWLDLLLVECVERRLGASRPTILYDYPASQAALARVRQEADISVAERFELYVDGIELANGYHELLDADVLRGRNRRNNALREADGKWALPEESRLLEAMEAGLPPCAGVALGFDRLVMLAAGKTSLAEVMAFPFDVA